MRAAKVLDSFPAGHPHGCWFAEEYAARCRERGERATVVMDLERDAFLVVAPLPAPDTARNPAA